MTALNSTTNPQIITPKRALLSVSDKTGIVELAHFLHKEGVKILSTGGTARLLFDANIPVTEVSDYTGFPEMMGGRVKTLHPKIHAGLLARRDIDADALQMHHIPTIDLLVVNLYPFEHVTSNPDCDFNEAIENIDIGGPAMVRASAKNHPFVSVVVDPNDYSRIKNEWQAVSGISLQTRVDLAVKAYEHTAYYDGMIANYLGRRITSQELADPFPRTWNQQYHNSGIEMRYGENPHQKAAFYVATNGEKASIANAQSLQGKALSYNNIADTDAALECVRQFTEQAACVIVKHANPCGVALADTVLEAYDHAYKTDPESAFGGIIAFNQALDADTARSILERQFVEVIIAPEVTPDALAILSEKQNIRVLVCGELNTSQTRYEVKQVNGGILVQDSDTLLHHDLTVVTERQPTEEEMRDLLFCWKVAKFVKSNAIVYSHKQTTVGIGAGQMSRVNSARIASIKAEHAGLEVSGSVMASDAFFPFRDGIDQAASAGIQAVIQPGGSLRDDEVIAAANEHKIAMVFTGMRHFKH